MSRPDRVLVVFSLLVAIASWGAGCGGPPSHPGAACSSDEECRPDARCSSRSCVVNTQPVADFAIAGDLQASSLVTLDGSASRDPDQGDAITSYFWTVEPDGASCAAPDVASNDPVVQVRFGCAGQFRAQLIVLDGKHSESAPATRSLEIKSRSAPPLVQTGPDQTIGHLCSGAPLTCRVGGTVQLTAAVSTQAPVSFRWSAQPPPGRALDAHRRVRFVPDASAQNPTVEIETDGTAISGDWQFRVEVRDGAGVLDADVTRVSVTNHPPVIRGGPTGPFEHAFDASSRLFMSGGTLPVEATDEDGDPIVRQVAFHHAGDGGAPFLGEDLGTGIRFSVAVPYGSPSDALFLRGGDGLDRSVAFTVTDVNGGTASAELGIEIGDRSPVMWSGGELAAAHTYDPRTKTFQSQPIIGRWTDPDGDPLSHDVTTDSECPTFTVQADGSVRAQCSRAFTGMASLPGFLRDRAAQIRVADPWTVTTSTSTFRIGNRAPVIAGGAYQPAVECRLRTVRGPWCPGTGSGMEPANLFPTALLHVPLGVSDPEGDPMSAVPSAGGTGASCTPGQQCSLTFLMPEAVSCDFSPPDLSVQFAATDGAASSSGSVQIDPRCL